MAASERNTSTMLAHCEEKGWYFAVHGGISGPFRLTFTAGQATSLDLQNLASKLAVSRDILPKAISEEIRREITMAELSQILATTVKADEAAKITTFLNMLLAQTHEDMFNVGFQGVSTTGKSYIPLEIASYFPEDERREYSHASPQSVYHEATDWRPIQEVAKELDLRGIFDADELANPNIRVHVLDFEHKIIIFVDQPNWQLTENLRSFLSHDRKVLRVGITDKSRGGSLRTKVIVVKGFAAVFFSSASSSQDEQEKTRTWIFFPDPRSEKIDEAMKLLARKVANRKEFRQWLSSHPPRSWLIERVKQIRQEGVRNVNIPEPEKVLERFKAGRRLQPRLQRDLPRFLCLIKAFALLNCFHRTRTDTDTIVADDKDVDAAFQLYEKFAMPNELGLSAQSWWVYQLLLGMPEAQTIGVGRGDILRRYLTAYGTPLSPDRLRRQILPELESAGVIEQKPNLEDNRESLVFLSPLAPPISGSNGNTGRMGDPIEQMVQAGINRLEATGGAPLSEFTRAVGRKTVETMAKRGLIWIIRPAMDQTQASVILREAHKED